LFNLAVFISGSGSNLQAVIDATENGTIPKAKVALVVSSREGVYGLERAKKHNIPNMVIGKKDLEKLPSTLAEYKTDGILLVGYLSLLPPDVVKKYSGKIINIHPALLPKFGGKGFYGNRVHQAVLDAGDKISGATVHLVDFEYDTGPTLIQGIVPVLPDDTAESLHDRILPVEHVILVQAVKALVEGKLEEMVRNPVVLE